ncbi:4-hydroxyphenylpyruvate dioxygenase [Marinihelvus fidelis]|uniref:4-hydroxyphenylpyruvate dioxygenase n=1 Tax=Marinihelvus fidelis TaxID=2613842 RepID=A0A5N0T493_9GAMM|nr:4-hydroxyphenylpyruvate dioxygenase [Marinihelvus fidelis]KAA9129618.1 4-hydroxyphenylpyruvate dioxygenase [Marinihelvus fidelis]
MTEHRDNPLGVEGFEFIEFAAPEPQLLHDLFKQLGFAPIARHRSRAITLYRQGDINFLVNEQPDSFATRFATEHGPCCTGFALRVADAAHAYSSVLTKGAESMSDIPGAAIDGPRIRGIGGSMLYLVDRQDGSALAKEYELIEGADPNHKGFGLTFIDHLTHNVFFGNMDEWADFYTRLFGFYEVRYFDIKGQQTGLKSRAMTAPNGNISIPINESEDPKSQINEYLDLYKGEGVQHIALFTNDIYETVEALREKGVEFLSTPDTYYEIIDRRVPEHDEDVARMKRNRILIDADQQDSSKQLLQIFTQTNVGPIFFEIIQRKGNQGFGEGNFTALFESIELDQQRRGVL